MSFQQNNLNGEVPHSLFNFLKLQILSLVGNKLSGKILPSVLIGFPNLEELYLANNQFSGTIPSSISNLSKITTFSLFNNSFSGHLPITVGDLGQLQILELSFNHFTNNLSIPEQDFLTSLAKCKYLSWLTIESNPITGELPKSLGTGNVSKVLEKFLAYSSGISGQIPIEISNISSLIWLSMGSNRLVGQIPESFGSLTNLRRLVLYDNMLQGSIPNSFCNMKNLYYLSLRGIKLSGNLPLCLGSIASLKELYLEKNNFSSKIPSTLWFNTGIQKVYLYQNLFDGTLSQDIRNMKSVIELYLFGNQLSGGIPDSIQELQSLTNLSLSNNKFFGPIPESSSNLKELKYLDLSHNNLSGEIPMSLERLVYLGYFNVSFNELSGEIPNEGPFRNFTAEYFIGNKGLCGVAKFQVDACGKNRPKHSSKSNILRYIVPPAGLVFVATIIMYLVIRYRRKKSSGGLSVFDLSLGFPQERVSYYEIVRATNNLGGENLIGRGGFGSVYKGVFSNEKILAVKVFNLDVQGALKSFDIECQIMRSIRHRNLVKVINSCSNLDFKALLMEYMPNGNLDKWLHSTECSSNISQRLGVMIDVATAVEYLHHGYTAPIIHCDLKPSNILSDSNMVAHVTDFGIAKLLSVEQTIPQTKTLGTIGYLAPEYGSEGLVSTAVDVYSYGILLMETFTRRKPTDEMFFGNVTMKKWVTEKFPDSLMQIVNADLVNINEESVRIKHENCLISIIGLALECTKEVSEERPHMKHVLVRIKKIKDEL